jgi:hypothetical protein
MLGMATALLKAVVTANPPLRRKSLNTQLMPEWSDNPVDWQDAGAPASVSPSGDRFADWTFGWPVQPNPFFIRLKASD